ncbi:deoxyribodipyrimidine photo-lyase [Bosea sp. 117]|uniref:cryptochrome/photolyase family protein n=1 Tax=Bosea sp. 117 TaxID=1125973 RepID=UPI0004947F4B|nr:deoxyribodipyrimidine photo-lyase [Bosea sp. 117]
MSSDPDHRPALVWVRDDQRLADNPALDAAAQSGRLVLLLHVLDEESPGIRPLGGAARWWLGRSLAALGEAARAHGLSLVHRRGAAAKVLDEVIAESRAGAVYWNRRYGAAEIALDRAIKESLTARGTEVRSFGGSLLHEPWTVLTGARQPFRVFTPFFRAASAREVRRPTRMPASIPAAAPVASEALEAWALEPSCPDWAGGLRASWTPGESGARQRLADFLGDGLPGYADARDRADREATSRLSPFLRFGNVSPHQVLAAVRSAEERGTASARDVAKFVSELYWREFSYHLLFHFPELPWKNVQPRFDAFAWRDDAAFLKAWQTGRTGYPIVDAGLRQLWETGWMHNRVRMVAASFLVKHGLIDWREGEAWFWDTLVDADAANNAASWQWVAGSGADAAPYFRIFNPVLQGEKFDPDGAYVRRFVPELAALPAEAIHKPWAAHREVLSRAGVELGVTYPHPIVDHASARARALAAYDAVKG